MKHLPDFPLVRPAKLSRLFIDRHVTHFHEAVAFLGGLPYRRGNDPRDLSLIFTNPGGSFTARNALLVQLAREQGVTDLSLTLCMHEFNQSCAGVGAILAQQGLTSIPEARGCVWYRGQRFSIADDSHCLSPEVLSEIEIAPAQVGTFKQRYHKNYLSNWLQIEKLDRAWSVESLWEVRAECLRHVAQQWNERLRSKSI